VTSCLVSSDFPANLKPSPLAVFATLFYIELLSTCCICVALDFALYEEVEPYTGLRPVVILGALADQVVTALLENLPNMFYQCEKGMYVFMYVQL